VLVNGFKACKRVPSEQEREKSLHYFPPETLLSRNYVESEKNDVWGIGCIVLQMELNKQLKNSALHPYNRKAVSFGNEGREMV
jgi:serine/threonine protein kinase